jgi:hypothetical protein
MGLGSNSRDNTASMVELSLDVLIFWLESVGVDFKVTTAAQPLHSKPEFARS